MESLGVLRASAGEIRVERLEQRLEPRVPFPHRHDFFHFVALERGGGWHEIDFERFPVKAPQLFLVKPGEVHAWHLSSSTRGFVLEFTESSIGKREERAQVLEMLRRFPAALGGRAVATLFPVLELMAAEFHSGAAHARLSLEHLLLSFLIQLSRAVPAVATEGAPKDSLISRFRSLVEQKFEVEHSVEFYASNLGVTAKALTTRVSRALGKSAGSVIQERCLTEAKRLLAHSALPVSEIAYRLGYDDPNYFARFFRQKAGLAPGKFRELAARSVPH